MAWAIAIGVTLVLSSLTYCIVKLVMRFVGEVFEEE